MTLSDALKLATSDKHKKALAIIATYGYIMDVRKCGRNTAYALCKARGFSFNRTLNSWIKR